MRVRVVAVAVVLCPLILGRPDDGVAQRGPNASTTQEHILRVVVPTVLVLIPPDPEVPGGRWVVRTNDPLLRRRLALGPIPTPATGEGEGPLVVTLAPP